MTDAKPDLTVEPGLLFLLASLTGDAQIMAQLDADYPTRDPGHAVHLDIATSLVAIVQGFIYERYGDEDHDRLIGRVRAALALEEARQAVNAAGGDAR